eukprot:5612369-Amphidinium_carterae.1
MVRQCGRRQYVAGMIGFKVVVLATRKFKRYQPRQLCSCASWFTLLALLQPPRAILVPLASALTYEVDGKWYQHRLHPWVCWTRAMGTPPINPSKVVAL